MRPDLAGVYAASWLYDPQLASVSPKLTFVRKIAEAGGARFLRLRTDPVQIAYATAHSPVRRQLMQSGAYSPTCYGLHWDRHAFIAWAERTQNNLAAPQKYFQRRGVSDMDALMERSQ
jgi:hypothetical protein